ncbi:lipoprotein [Spiroplasma endosymbiont of Labia minor]
MKKLLSMLAVLGLTTTGATSVVACGAINLA